MGVEQVIEDGEKVAVFSVYTRAVLACPQRLGFLQQLCQDDVREGPHRSRVPRANLMSGQRFLSAMSLSQEPHISHAHHELCAV